MSERVNDPRLQLLERTPEGDLQLQGDAQLLDADGNVLAAEGGTGEIARETVPEFSTDAGNYVEYVLHRELVAEDFDTPIQGAVTAEQTVDVGGAILGADPTGLADDTAGFQVVDVGGAKVGGSATGLSNDPDAAGFQVVDVGGTRVGGDATGLANDSTIYEAIVSVDGGAPQGIALLGSAAQIYTDLLTELNAETTGATWALIGGNLRLTSDTPSGAGSTILLTDLTEDDVFAALTDFVEYEAPVAGTSLTTYTASVVIDGAASEPISIEGPDAQTYTDLLAELNADTTGTWAIVSGNLRLTSGTLGVASTVVITAGTLFPALDDFVEIEAAVDGTTTDYTFTFFVDDSGAVPVTINGAAAQDYDSLVAQLNTATPGFTWSVATGNLVATADTPGAIGSFEITLDELFQFLTDFVEIEPRIAGEDAITSVGILIQQLPADAIFLGGIVRVPITSFNPGTSLTIDVNIGDFEDSGETMVNDVDLTIADVATLSAATTFVGARVVGEFEGDGTVWVDYILTGAAPTVGRATIIVRYFVAAPLPA